MIDASAVGEVVGQALVLPDRRELVHVEVPRELRGLWVATVANLDFPTRQNLSPGQMAAELDRLVLRSKELGLNALVFQVRPESDALYASSLEPWSRYLTGVQGKDPGFDPLGYLVEHAHAEGIQVHAWFNPYRAASNKSALMADNHVTGWAGPHIKPWGSLLWTDPGVPQVRDHTLSVVSEVLDRYDVDGIHLDDYFYPYPLGGKTFPDEASFSAYQSTGGALDRDAWRRDNVDALVSGIARLVHEKKPEVRFGISPFGIYRPGFPEGVRGLDQVATLHADPMKWYREGWVDYLAPQLYWPTTKKLQPYGRLLEWWDDHSEPERPLLVGLDITRVGKDPAWTTEEIRTQVMLSRQQDQTEGQIWFRATPILEDRAHLASLMSELYATPALPPALVRATERPVEPPTVAALGEVVGIAHVDRAELRAFVLYRDDGEGYLARQVLGPAAEELTLGCGAWAISAVDRAGHESEGAVVDLGGACS